MNVCSIIFMVFSAIIHNLLLFFYITYFDTKFLLQGIKNFDIIPASYVLPGEYQEFCSKYYKC